MLGRSQDVSSAAQRALLHLLCLFNGLEIFEEVAPNIRQVRLVLQQSSATDVRQCAGSLLASLLPVLGREIKRVY